MPSSGNQTELGKAFEYACAFTIHDKCLKADYAVEIEPSPQVDTAKRFFEYLNTVERNNYLMGAKAALRIIERLEPKLSDYTGDLVISLQTDSKGQEGDVRDVLITIDKWEIGLSCKHNHEAVKHSRLSDTIDFGKDWFGKSCSQEYFDDVRNVFLPLRKIRDESKAAGNPALWSDIPDKEQNCYVPVLEAFMKELKRLDKEYPGEIPALLVRYLIGDKDFYKVIMNDKRGYTQIESININGTLNQPNGNKQALINVPIMKLPTKFYEIDFKEGQKNTVVVVCDQGWNISMRIHNASSKIEPSLKFDVQLMAMPSSILTQIEPWETYKPTNSLRVEKEFPKGIQFGMRIKDLARDCVGVVVGVNDNIILAAFEGEIEPRIVPINEEFFNLNFLLLD